MKKRSAIARYGDVVIARTTQAVRVEGNYYFPLEDVDADLAPSALTTLCPWKGIARYRHVVVEGHTLHNAAWTYPLPLPLAWGIRRRIAFEPSLGIVVTAESLPKVR
ncbi:DUF427 domain-containing protein [Devriesea agamarum]|uniref:DUF427 domain-containing protein n=1 Tax=Devriesea agamarum TaxID=472569 RepID=UPI00071DECD9|nr:DUF427 domain-containing protein [Devriesea agamarum]